MAILRARKRALRAAPLHLDVSDALREGAPRGAHSRWASDSPTRCSVSSDHSLGNYTCFAAVALGASILEKHFTSDKTWPGPDVSISIDPRELGELVAGTRAIHQALGGTKEISARREAHHRLRVRLRGHHCVTWPRASASIARTSGSSARRRARSKRGTSRRFSGSERAAPRARMNSSSGPTSSRPGGPLFYRLRHAVQTSQEATALRDRHARRLRQAQAAHRAGASLSGIRVSHLRHRDAHARRVTARPFTRYARRGFDQVFRYINQDKRSVLRWTWSSPTRCKGSRSTYVSFPPTSSSFTVIASRRLAGAIVGALNNVLVAHVEGGELSGTIDELLRHAVTKLSHLHFVANEEARRAPDSDGRGPRVVSTSWGRPTST